MPCEERKYCLNDTLTERQGTCQSLKQEAEYIYRKLSYTKERKDRYRHASFIAELVSRKNGSFSGLDVRNDIVTVDV